MKLYTKRGDDGATDLFGGERVSKDSPRIAVVGTVDEVNAAVGLAVAACGDGRLRELLTALQSRLFDLGADLATPRRPARESPVAVTRISLSEIEEAERTIDECWAPLPEMRFFVLPGGTELSARLHVARAACRRAERECVALARSEDLGPHVSIFLNRLSDLLFAMARRANQVEGVADVPWVGRRR